jgi:putative NIF3 family GTP cyclohydrolase 1 type 2
LPYDIHAYVTGDVGYHDALKALERGVGVVDAGHGPTETPVLARVAAHLRNHLEVEVVHWTEPEVFAGVPN